MKLKNERRTTPCLPAGRNHERRGKNEWRSRSFTLIEFIVVITIVGILTVGLSTYIIKGIDLWQLITFRNEITASGRLALFRMGREIRQIKNNSSISKAEASRFEFTDVNNNVIDYQLSSGNLTRNADDLAKNVESLKFCYYKSDDSAVCTPVCGCSVAAEDLSSIYRISMEIEVSSGSETKTLTSQIHPRNL